MKLWAGPDLEMIHWIILNVCKYKIFLSQHTDGMFLYLLSEEIKKGRVKEGMRDEEVEKRGSGITGALAVVKWVRSTDHV